MITSTITLGSLTFGDVEFQGWSFRELIDWWGQTEDKLDVVERPQAHGAFDVERSLRSSRAISFTGTFVGSDQASVENAYDDLSAVGAEGPVQMVVTTPAGATMRTVTVERVTPVDHRGRKYGRFAVDLIARDPRRYTFDVQSAVTGPVTPGQGRTWPAVWPLVWPAGGASGRITLTNTGKAPTAPTFILEGGFDTALITCLETGARIGFNRQVPVGSSVVINTAERRAIIDGQSDVSRWLRYREWEVIPPGASRTFQFDATGVVVEPGVVIEVARSLTTNPNAVSASGFLTLDAANWTVTRNVAAPSAHPQAIITAARSTQAGGPNPAAYALSMYNIDNLSNSNPARVVGAWFWVNKAGFSAGISNVNGGSTPIAANTWVWVTGSVPANTFARATLASSGSVDSDTQAFITGVTVLTGVSAPVRTIAGGVSYLESGMSAQWVGAANDSQSALMQTNPDQPTASLEGQVRSAWW